MLHRVVLNGRSRVRSMAWRQSTKHQNSSFFFAANGGEGTLEKRFNAVPTIAPGKGNPRLRPWKVSRSIRLAEFHRESAIRAADFRLCNEDPFLYD